MPESLIDMLESFNDVPALTGDKTPGVVVTRGLGCGSGERLLSAVDRIVEAAIDLGR